MQAEPLTNCAPSVIEHLTLVHQGMSFVEGEQIVAVEPSLRRVGNHAFVPQRQCTHDCTCQLCESHDLEERVRHRYLKLTMADVMSARALVEVWPALVEGGNNLVYIIWHRLFAK